MPEFSLTWLGRRNGATSAELSQPNVLRRMEAVRQRLAERYVRLCFSVRVMVQRTVKNDQVRQDKLVHHLETLAQDFPTARTMTSLYDVIFDIMYDAMSEGLGDEVFGEYMQLDSGWCDLDVAFRRLDRIYRTLRPRLQAA